MKIKQITKFLLYFLLIIDIIIFIVISIFHSPILFIDSDFDIILLAMIFIIVFMLSQLFNIRKVNFSNFSNCYNEQNIQLSTKNLERILYKASLKTSLILISFGLLNVILLLINLVIYNNYSFGNLFLSGLLIYPIADLIKTRNKIKESIYYNSKIRFVVKESSIELYSDKLHHSLSFNDIGFYCKIDKWIIYNRKNHSDYILTQNK